MPGQQDFKSDFPRQVHEDGKPDEQVVREFLEELKLAEVPTEELVIRARRLA